METCESSVIIWKFIILKHNEKIMTFVMLNLHNQLMSYENVINQNLMILL